MLNEIILAIIQAVTEFLPVSSSGHLALYSLLFSEVNLFFITVLHVASLLAVVVFLRKEIVWLFKFSKEARKMWMFLIIATIPAGFVGIFLKNYIESSLSSFLFIGAGFLFTGFVVLSTKIKVKKSKQGFGNSFFVGLFQALALFPGASRSGMTISSGKFLGFEKEKIVKFSFLLFIPLAIAAFISEFGDAYFSVGMVISFVLCFVLSLLFLHLLMKIVIKEKFWMFSIYLFVIGVVSLILGFI